jgi:hypothetical protein
LRAQAEEIVASVRRDSNEGILLPYGWELKLLSSPSSRSIDISATIDRYDNRIAITMLSDIILIGEKSGSFALADTKQSLLAGSLQAQVENIADEFNAHVVPMLFAVNSFPGITEFPKIVPSQIQTPSLQEVSLVLRSMGLNIAGDQKLQNYLRHILSMPKLDNETFKNVYLPQAFSDKDKHDQVSTADGTRDLADASEQMLQQPDMAYTGVGGV